MQFYNKKEDYIDNVKFWFKYRLKFYAPQVQPYWGLNL